MGEKNRCTGPALAAAVLCLLLWSCSLFEEEEPRYVERPVEDLYNTAMDSLLVGDYFEAARLFDEVERQHPYSTWAAKAQLMSAFAFYQNNKYDEAINALDRFIQLHPGNKDVAYAHYLRAISYYEQISDVGRDQKFTKLALDALEEVARRFPESRYARDVSLKIDLARDHLAGKHMEIGRFYLKQGEFLAAINRFRLVIQDYQTTTHVPEALHRLVESYLVLGVTDEAQATAAVLGHNYPGSPWYADSYVLLTGIDLRPEEYQGSWISRVWNSLI
ncbi:MAG: outer membrane protein assembly factor BamD [Kiloniellales bacterium]